MKKLPIAALFDLDGVIVDTEPQYTVFWDNVGAKYLYDNDNFGAKIKGNTLRQIYDRHFSGHDDWQQQISRDLLQWEANMHFELIPGVSIFLQKLRKAGIRTAIVTSSDNAKMESLWRAQPLLRKYFDTIITANDITHSKPDPEGYLLAASRLGASPHDAVVFEDSRAGLQAGRAGGMKVIGLTTTLTTEEVNTLADISIPNFINFTPEMI